MTTSPPVAPPWTLGWRLRRSMEFAKVSRDEIAQYVGVAPSTVTRWTHDDFKRPPNRANLLAWAQITGVPLEWLERGDEHGEPPPAAVTEGDEAGAVPATVTLSDKKSRNSAATRKKLRDTPSYHAPYGRIRSSAPTTEPANALQATAA